MYSKVESEPKHEIAIIEREFKFRKRMAFFVLGSLRIVPLHSTLAVNNLIRFKVCFVKCVIK